MSTLWWDSLLSLSVVYVLNSIVDHNELWAEQFLRIDLHQKKKEASGNNLGKDRTRRTESSLIICSPIQDCITLRAATLAELN